MPQPDERYYVPPGIRATPPPRASQMGRYVGGGGLPTLTASSFGQGATGQGRYYSPVFAGPPALGQFPNGPQAYADFKRRYPTGSPVTTPNAPTTTVTPYAPSGVGTEAYLPPNDTYYGGTPKFAPPGTQTPGTTVPGATAPRTRTWRDVGHEQIDTKLGQGWVDRFSSAHGLSPLDFYSDKRNWFGYQRDAAMDYGVDSKEFANATIRATIQEGLMHQQEAAQWQQLHGNTPIPPEMWQRWFYANRGSVDEKTGLMGDGLPVVY